MGLRNFLLKEEASVQKKACKLNALACFKACNNNVEMMGEE